MPRYFFNVFNGQGDEYVDDIGEHLPDRAAAWEIATRYAGESLRDLNGRLTPDRIWRLEVTERTRSDYFRSECLPTSRRMNIGQTTWPSTEMHRLQGEVEFFQSR